VFSIKEMEHFSGIKAHTIRIWELRHGLFKPQRSNTNIRSYSLQDLRHLLNITLLLNNGYRISKIALADKSEIEEQAYSLAGDENRQCLAINHLVFYMYTDIEKFEDTLDSCVLCWGIDTTIKKIILPFMEKVELLSYKDKSFEAHFVVTALRKKLIVGIEKEKTTPAAQQTALLFLAQGEHYDLFLLYITYILKKKGVRILYLGTDISVQSLKYILELKKPDMLYTYVPQKAKFRLADFAIYLQKKIPAIVFNVVTCEPIQVGESVSNLNFLHYSSMHALNVDNVQSH
jgi:DNA-binding transcriptional MerR regulator